MQDNYNITGNNNTIIINGSNNTINQQPTQKQNSDDFVNSKSFKLHPKKLQTLEIAKLYRNIGDYKKSRNIFYCAKDVELWADSKKIKYISSCRSRMCPACAWRKSIKLYKKALYAAMNALKVQNINFIFVTLTIKNCSGDNLYNTVDKLLKAYRMLMKRGKLSKTLGSIKSLEITVNWKNMSYHPHLHIVFAVPDDYFINPELYITIEELRKNWADKLKIADENYRKTLQVDIKTFGNTYTLLKSLKEITKYMLKYGDLADTSININKRSEALNFIDNATKGRRMVEFTGIFRQKEGEKPKKELEEEILQYQFNYKNNLYEEI